MLLFLGLGIAGAVAARASDPPPRLEVSGTGAALSDRRDIGPPAAGDRSGASQFGEVAYRGLFDLADAHADGDRVLVPLDDGRTAVLTLDPTLQKTAEDLLAEANAPVAAIVVMSVDGRLLALAAASQEDPDLDAAELATQPWAPSASVFKLVTSAALLEAGVRPDDQVCYHGGLRSVEQSNLTDDARADGLCNSLAYALAHSQNAIIAKLAHRTLNATTLRSAADRMGYDVTPAFALPAAPSPTDIPDEPLELARAAAGFWHSELSPIAGAVLADTIASGGLTVTPRLISAVIDDGVEVPVLPTAPHRAIDAEIASSLRDMMIPVTESGTARKGFRDGSGKPYLSVSVAGKTGSLSRKSPTFLDYSWFVGFAPADAPQVVVSVVLGNSPSYRFKAHTLARLVLEAALR